MLTLQTSFKPFAQVGEGVKSGVEVTVNSEEEIAFKLWKSSFPQPAPLKKIRRQIQNRILSLVSLAIKVTVSRDGIGF
jgi:hypothetical protein